MAYFDFVNFGLAGCFILFKKWVISLCYTWNKPKLTKSKYAIYNILLSNTIKPLKTNIIPESSSICNTGTDTGKY
jgi:hypothetical protein